MDSLAQRLASLEAGSLKTGCRVQKIIIGLDNDTAEALKSVLASNASTMSIVRELNNEGIKIDRQSMTRHRQGTCICVIKGDNNG